MTPYFYSFSEFLAMGKHGIYVWSSWGLVTLTMAAFILYSRMQRRRLYQQLKLQYARQAQHDAKRSPPTK